MRIIFYGLFGSLAFGASAVAATGSLMDLGMIDRAVADFTGSQIGQPGGAKLPVDRRMRLSACPAPLDLSWFGRDRRSIQVACPSAGWRIYVAVDGADVGQGMTAAPAPKLIRRGEAVSIVAQGHGFSLARQGEAMEDGAQGDWIRVRPVGNKTETVRAQVLRPGKVGITLP
ncbi:MAG: flagella basal body P-ring formation protein FlgA [Sphingomonadaceae bacterium]